MKKTLSIGALALLSAMSQASFTLATFSDPSNNSSTPLFTWSKINNTLAGSWTGMGLNLVTPGLTNVSEVKDARMMFDTVSTTPIVPNLLYNLGAGRVRFYTSDVNNPFLTITFDSGSFLNPNSVGASNVVANNVKFIGANVPQNLTEEQFSFSFANSQASNTQVTYTSSFTSSASVVPEPVSMIALGVGLVSMGARRLRRKV